MRIRTLAIATMLLATTGLQAQNFELQYQSDSGALNLVNIGGTNATTVELKSEGGQLTGDRPAHFSGLFDVYNANKAFKLDPAGFSDIPGFAFIAAGADGTDITVDGSLVGGGPIGDVAITGFAPIVDPPPTGGTNFTYDAATGNLDFNAGGKSVTTLELKSAGGLFTGDRPAHFSGLFDVYAADKAFKLDPAGFGDIPGFAMLAPGLTNAALVADFGIDGSLVGGGPLGDVAIIGGQVDGGGSFCDTSAAAVCLDFESAVPDGTLVFGDTAVRDAGGNGGGGYLSVTDAANGQRGGIVFPALGGSENQLVFGGRTGGANGNHHIDNIEVNVDGNNFSIAADLRVGGGTDRPADGFSFNFARPGDPVLADGNGYAASPGGEENLPEEGTTTGIAIGFDEWDSGAGDVVGLSVRVDGELVEQIEMPTLNGALDDITSLQTGPNDNGVDGLGWAKLEIDVTGDASASSFIGKNLRIAYKGAEVFNAEIVPEPTSFTLIGMGVLALGLARRRRS